MEKWQILKSAIEMKSQWNFVEHFAIYVKSIYIQIQLDFNIEHIW